MNTFNLGTLRVPEQEPGESDEIVGFGPEELRKHVAVLGSTGSGKTVVSKGIIEECALAGIPVIAIDVQGDLAHLARAPQEDARSDPERQSEWVKKTDVRVWTPLSEHGLPICLDPFNPPSGVNELDLIGSWDRLATGLTSLLGADPSKPKGRQAKTFLDNHMKTLAEKGEAPYDFGELAESIRAVDPKDVEEAISAPALKELGRNAEANAGGLDSLLYSQGTPLEIDTLLQRRKGEGTPVNVLFLNTLPNENLKQVFIQQLCRKLYDWLLVNRSDESLQCVLLLDEARAFLPAGMSNPPAKEILNQLLAQGRKFGLGIIIASQNPGKLDYESLGQTNSTFLGKLKTKQEWGKIDQLLHEASDPKGVLSGLSSMEVGEFVLSSPVYKEPVHMRSRWLLTPHGDPLVSEDLVALTPEPLRKWASGFVRRTPKRLRVPSWRRKRVEGASPELLHGIATLGSVDDPMKVMLTITNVLTFATLILTTYHMGQSYIAGDLVVAWLAIGGGISVVLSSLFALDWFLREEADIVVKVREKARGFEWVVLSWMWVIWGIDWLEWVDLGWAYYPVMASQTLLTVFVVMEYLHSLRLAGIRIEGTSLLDRVRSVGVSLTEAERARARSSSDELMQRFSLLTATLTIGLITTLLWTGADLGSGIMRDAAVRIVTLEGSVLIAIAISIWSRGK